MSADSPRIGSSVRSVDGRDEIQFARTTEWNAPVQITLRGETIEVHSGPLSEAVRLVNLEGEPS